MTDPTVTAAEPLDQTEPPEEAAKRAAFVADLRAFADWLTESPWAPTPHTAEAMQHLNATADVATAAPSLARLREIAARTGGSLDESLHDRTRLTVMHGTVEYKLLTWHPDGRPGEPDKRDAELERLRAEVAKLRAAVPAGALGGDDGLSYSREADDPTPVSPARVPLHTGGMVGPVDGGTLVDETVPGLIVGDTAAEQRDNAYAAYERDEAEDTPT